MDRLPLRNALVVGWVMAACAGPSERGEDVPRLLRADTASILESDEFFRIGATRVVGDRILVANQGSLQVLVLGSGSGGRVEGRIGGRGQGPGEFQALTDIAASGDSLWVLDALQQRLQFFVGGNLERGWSLRELPGTPNRVFLGPDSEVWLITRDRGPLESAELNTVLRDSIRAFRQDLRSATPGTEARWIEGFTLPGREYFVADAGGGAVWIGTPPFGADTYVQALPQGLLAADGRTGRVIRLPWDGGDATVVDSVPAEIPLIRQDELDRWREEVDGAAQQWGDPDEYRSMVLFALDLWGPEVPRPAFRRFVAGPRGLAAQRYQPRWEEGPAIWTVVRFGSEVRGRWIVPPDITVRAMDDDRILAIRRDAFGVESLMVLGWFAEAEGPES